MSLRGNGVMKQNLPGGSSAVVPPDPMPNSEVKRRSADGSVGSPHVRVGNCRASNKAKGSVERLGLLFYLLFVGERLFESRTKSSGTILHSTECCPEGDGQEARHTTARHQTVKKPILTDGLFASVPRGKCRMAASPYPAYRQGEPPW